ncbi:MAG: hypothetical protein WA126_16005 [Thermodesulfovibrionales bacterium]
MKMRIMHWVHNTFEQPFGYLRIAGLVIAFVLIPLCIAYMISPNPTRLHAEDGVIEWLSFGCWIVSILICFKALSRQNNRADGLVFCWACLICVLAAARELDAQVLLNPKYLGQFGVRYKTIWFLSSEVSILLRLFWFAFFLTIGGIIIWPLVVMRKAILWLIRSGDAAAGFLLLSFIGSATGFVFDDILRETAFLDIDLRQAIEETVELFGATFFLICIASLLWKPFSERTGAIDSP